MRRLLLLLFLLLIYAAGTARADVRVLLYHRVGDGRYPTTNVSLESFRAEMIWLKDNGYKVVSTAALEEYLLRGGKLPEKAVVIQFDDGLRSVYTTALPVLREFGYPFSIFVTTEPVEKGYPDYVTWGMLEEMVKAGGEIGVHGHSHQRMAGPARGEDMETFRKRMAFELLEPKRLLEKRGLASVWFAYTFGEYGPDLVAATRAAGYRLGFVQDPGAVDAESDPFLLNRYAVVGSVAEMGLFKERMTYGALHLTDRLPQYGAAETDSPVVYSAKILNPERYIPNTVNVFVSELGKLETSYDAATGVVTCRGGKKLGNYLNRVIVTIKERITGKYALGSWAIITGKY